MISSVASYDQYGMVKDYANKSYYKIKKDENQFYFILNKLNNCCGQLFGITVYLPAINRNLHKICSEASYQTDIRGLLFTAMKTVLRLKHFEVGTFKPQIKVEFAFRL